MVDLPHFNKHSFFKLSNYLVVCEISNVLQEDLDYRLVRKLNSVLFGFF